MVHLGESEGRSFRMKNVIYVMLAVIASFVCALVALMFFVNPIKENWDLTIPKTCQTIKERIADGGFLGDDVRYHEYVCASFDEVEELGRWNAGPNLEVEKTVSQWLSELELKLEDELLFEAGYKYLKLSDADDKAYFIWLEQDSRLIFVESSL